MHHNKVFIDILNQICSLGRMTNPLAPFPLLHAYPLNCTPSASLPVKRDFTVKFGGFPLLLEQSLLAMIERGGYAPASASIFSNAALASRSK